MSERGVMSGQTVSLAARLVVALVFSALGLAFSYETFVLFREFKPAGLFVDLATFDAQNFIYFPIAGVAALFAFWRPTSVVVDACFRGVIRFGPIIFIVTILGLATASGFVSAGFSGASTRSMFEVAPAELTADQGRSFTCADQECGRARAIDAMRQIRLAAHEGRVRDFSLTCGGMVHTFLPDSVQHNYCFAAGQSLGPTACCAARTAFAEDVNLMYARAESATARAHRLVMPLKIFFLLAVLAVGVALVWRRRRLHKAYGDEMDRFDLAVLCGAGLILLWPVMNNAFLTSAALLYDDGAGGSTYAATAPLYTLGFGVWALVVLFYHLRRFPDQVETIAQGAGVVIGVFGMFQYENIVAWVGKAIGAGADFTSLLVFVALVGLVMWLFTYRDDEIDLGEDDDADDVSVV